MKIKLLTILIGITMLLVWCSCGKKKEIGPRPARPVKWIVLGGDEVHTGINLPGEVQATQRSHLAFQVPGQIIELPIIVGQLVKKGQLLARLDDKNYLSTLNKALAVEKKAKVDYERYKQLNDKKVVSDKEYEQKRRNYAVAISERKIAQKNENDTALRAPFDGIIANKSIKNFQNVKAEEKIIVLQDLQHLEIAVHVPVREISPGSKTDFDMYAVINNFPDQKFRLKIREFSTEIDQDTMTYEVTLEMIIPPDFENKVLPGMLANVYISKKQPETAGKEFLVPVQAVVADPKGNPYVWVIDPATMRVSKRPVTTGKLVNNAIVITGGLKNREMVAVSGAHYLYPDQLVKQYRPVK
ncbi:MAG: efflux RND transporter periplasmic adaptor subunit [Victivallaceae bacterium]|nr:efflux RND transporter periplasmic adaptor subunit [Victivallaceae bacterium]